MSAPQARVLLHVARDRRRAIDPEDVYFLEAVGETTLVRLRSARRVRDVRALGDLLKTMPGAGLVQVHRNHAVNVVQDQSLAVEEVRRIKADPDNLHHLGSPMAGMVVEVHAKAGAKVDEGDKLIVLEAMKMEMILASPLNGVVAHIA